MIRVKIKDRQGEVLFRGSYHMMDSAIEAMGNFDRHATRCLQCKEYVKEGASYCSGLCEKLSFDSLKK